MRPAYRDAFNFERLINVFFYTSNTNKLLQARLMFVRHGYELRHYRGHREPYDEDYDLGTHSLLKRAIAQVNEEYGLGTIFFVEDTSLRLEAFSDKNDYPGLRVKEWFPDTTFGELDRQINLRGGDRTAIVKSDIALHFPTLSRPIFVHGQTCGRVASVPPDFEPSVQYPWLTPHTFNGWFIPDGSSRRLGEMEFEESLTHDFRAKSLCALIERLEELNAALNLWPTFYTTRKIKQKYSEQLQLISEQDKRVVIVIGYKCAGKTTLSDHLSLRENVKTFEASTVLRDIAEDKQITVKNSEDALNFLREWGMDVVAKSIGQYMDTAGSALNIITGLRTIDEIAYIVNHYPSARIVFVDADQRVRFERHIRRARDPEVMTYKDFRALDEEQNHFGALRVAKEMADIVINNNDKIEEFLEKVDLLIYREKLYRKTSGEVREMPKGELLRCLEALVQLGRTATCDEIAKVTAKLGQPVRRYNTNRALKSVPELARRIQKSGALLRYRLTPTGKMFVELSGALRAREDDYIDSSS